MELRVLFFGVPIGTTELPMLAGLAHGVLVPGAGYEVARTRVESAGKLFEAAGPFARRYWPSTENDFADAVASALGGAYELEDHRGQPVTAASVVLFALTGHESAPLIVADFRPHAAHVPAVLPDRDDAGDRSKRPAA